MSKKQKHILVIRLSAMGDVAMTIPVLRALETQYPDLKISVLTRSFFTPFFRDLNNTEVISAQVEGKHKGVYGIYKLGRELNKQGFYAIADLHNVLRSKLLKRFITSKQFISINKGRKEKQLLTSGELVKPLKTTHERYADVFKLLGLPLDLSNPKFPDKVNLSSKLQEFIGKGFKKVIGVAPFAAHEGKVYPLNQMEIVLKALSKTYKVLLFGGGKTEEEKLLKFENTLHNTTSLAGKLSLDEQLDVISNLDLMLSMDSGNAHLAAMLGVKVVTIWGVTHPYAGFAPFNQPDDYAILADRVKFPKIPTSVYGNTYPEAYKTAAGSISPEIIIEKISSIL